MARKNKKVVVFDFDGTLVNSMDTFADVAAKVMPEYFDITPEEARQNYLNTSGVPFFEQLEILFPKNPSNKAAAAEFESEKLKGYFKEPLFPDAAETVEYLQKRGIKVVVSSNNFENLVEAFISNTKIGFDFVLGYKEGGFAKGPMHFEHIEKSLNVGKKDILFVGDSLKDAEKALNYGVSFIGKEGIFTREDFHQRFPGVMVVGNLAELKAIF